MPKRMFLIALTVATMALAACGASYNPNDLYGTPAPTASPTPMTTPNASITSAIVTVTYQSVSQSGVPVSLYNDVGGHPGTLIATQPTNSNGSTTFTGLTGGSGYCFEASITPQGALTQTQTLCTNLWGFGVTFPF